MLHCGAYYQGPDSWSAPHHVLDRTLGRPVTALEVRQGCLAMLTSLRLAAALLTAEQDTAEAVLITGGDNFSTPLVDRWRDSEHAMYADSGAALVVSRAGGFAEVLSVVSRSVPELESMHRYGEPLLPPARPAERPLHVGPRLQAWSERPGAGAHDMIEAVTRYGQLVAETAEQGLAEAGIGRSGLARVARRRIPRGPAALPAAGLHRHPAKQGTWEFMRTIGHASVSDPVLGLEHLWTTGQVTEGDHVMLLGATEGMEAGCAVVRITTAYDRDA
ncbi:3-oxoacyl-[acyl-carrier-protein] synthase III C-terminal domain-containing protein [Streptomyces thioluteus]